MSAEEHDRSDPGPAPSELLQRFVHKARNPLATIRSSAQLVHHLIHPSGEVAQYLEGILAEVDTLDEALRDLKRLVQPVEPSAELHDVQELAREAARAVGAAAREAKVLLELAGGPQAAVRGPREPLCDALAELMRNGLESSPPGQTVVVGWSAEEARQVAIWVEDSCAGIGPEVARRMFQPFFSTSQRTGLGLSFAQRAAALAGGRLDWANRVPVGCRFTLTLPGR
ncbi:MAG: HAMP domain-containing sensor histidine kinase [Myxococcales bacterium]